MPRTEKRIRVFTPVRVSFEQRLAAERLYERDPIRWRSPTHVLRVAAQYGLPFVSVTDVGVACTMRRRRGISRVIGFWPETLDDARARGHLGGPVSCRIVAAIDHGLALGALIPPPAPIDPRTPPPWLRADESGERVEPPRASSRCSQCRGRKGRCRACRERFPALGR